MKKTIEKYFQAWIDDFDDTGKIRRLSEFQSKPEHYFPYEE